jgi:hypothetical protein
VKVNIENDRAVTKRPGPLLPVIAIVIIPTSLVLWYAVGVYSSAITFPDTSIYLVVLFTQIGLGVLYLGEWAAYAVSASKEPFSIIGVEISPVFACIAMALMAPFVIFVLGALL